MYDGQHDPGRILVMAITGNPCRSTGWMLLC